MPIAAAYSYV